MSRADGAETATGSPWLGITVATAIAATGFWIGLLFIETAPVVGLTSLALGAILSMLALAGFGGAEDPFKVGIRAAVLGLLTGSLLFVLWGVTGNGRISLLVPGAVLGVGGTAALPPIGDPRLLPGRAVAAVTAVFLVVAVAAVVPPLWPLLAPVASLPALGGADYLRERSRK